MIPASRTFILHSDYYINSSIIIGPNGIKIIYNYNNIKLPTCPIYILFDKIKNITIVTSWKYDSNRSPGYDSFKIECSTMEEPFKINIFEIKMNKEINEVHKLIIEGYKIACSKKDKIIGID